MKKLFHSRLEAIDWIAQHAEDELTFEILREQLNYNFIYEGKFILYPEKEIPQVKLEDDMCEN